MLGERLTCLIATHNRPQFLRRLLHFYRQFPPGFSFFIADSSDAAAATENLAAIDQAQGSLDITYQHFHVDLTTKCTRALKQIRTPYVVFCADDDFLFPAAVERCVRFLATQPGYSVAQGILAVMNCKKPGAPYHASAGFSISDDRVLVRCSRMASLWFSTYYGVYRTETLLGNFQITAANSDCLRSYFIPEMLLSQLSVLKGRVRVFPEIYYLIEAHDTNLGSSPKVAEPKYAEELYLQFRTCLSSQFEQTGISRASAGRLVDRWYGFMLDFGAAKSRNNTFSIPRIRRSLKRIWRKILNLFITDGIVYRRPVRASNLRGQEDIWNAARHLMATYPNGLPADVEAKRYAA